MKKILLAILLLLLVVAVSYVKTWREHQRSEDFYEKGQIDGAQQSADAQSEIDSLRTMMAERDLAIADSLVKKDQTYQATIDSLKNALDKEKTATKNLASMPTTVKKTTPEPTISKHEKILTYYKKRYANLPNDLSQYELKIALNEIREETSQKFAISLKELKDIRQKNKLSY